MKKQDRERPHIVIGGYYGFGNLGDEASLCSLLLQIERELPGALVSVLTDAPDALPKAESITLRGFSRTNPLTLLFLMLSADVYISGGGSLLQDCTSKKSLCYYCSLIRLAHLCRARVYILANGIGPLKDTKKCKKALMQADMISLRDPDSYEAAKALAKRAESIALTADPIFAYPFKYEANEKALRKKYIAVSLRRCEGQTEIDRQIISTTLLQLKSMGLYPILVSMQDSYDLSLCREIAASVGGEAVSPKSPDELYSLLSGATFAIGMRLHFLLISAIAGTPMVALSYDTKVESCCSYLNCNEVIPLNELTAKKIIRASLKVAVETDREALAHRCRELSRLARLDIQMLSRLILPNKEKKKSPEKFFADT